MGTYSGWTSEVGRDQEMTAPRPSIRYPLLPAAAVSCNCSGAQVGAACNCRGRLAFAAAVVHCAGVLVRT